MSFSDAIQEVSENLEAEYNYCSWLSKKFGIEIDNGIVTSIFPFLNSKSLIEPFKTDQINVDELHKVLSNYLLASGKGDIFNIHLLKVKDK